MNRLLIGQQYLHLHSKLPRNLVVFDGKCYFTTHHVGKIIERNFSFLSETEMEKHTLYFTSPNTEPFRSILQQELSFIREYCATSNIVLIEQVPPAFKGLRLGSSLKGSSLISALSDAECCDFRISTKSKALFRLCLHSDRWPTRWMGRIGLTFVPTSIGDKIYDLIFQKRRAIWGMGEFDVFTYRGPVFVVPSSPLPKKTHVSAAPPTVSASRQPQTTGTVGMGKLQTESASDAPRGAHTKKAQASPPPPPSPPPQATPSSLTMGANLGESLREVFPDVFNPNWHPSTSQPKEEIQKLKEAKRAPVPEEPPGLRERTWKGVTPQRQNGSSVIDETSKIMRQN